MSRQKDPRSLVWADEDIEVTIADYVRLYGSKPSAVLGRPGTFGRESLLGLKMAGVSSVQITVESFSRSFTQERASSSSVMQTVETLKWCAEFDLDPYYVLCTRYPGETQKHADETLSVFRTIKHFGPPRGMLSMMHADSDSRVNWKAVAKARDAWERSWGKNGSRPTLTASRTGRALSLMDSSGARVQRHTLRGITADIYRACMSESISIEQVVAATKISQLKADLELRELERRAWLFCSDGRYLAIATWEPVQAN